jgi:hypothetical protein
MRPQALNPAPLLMHRGINPLQAVQCPECKQGFVAGSGVMFCVPVVRGDEQTSTHLMFCGTKCILGWFYPYQMGHA